MAPDTPEGQERPKARMWPTPAAEEAQERVWVWFCVDHPDQAEFVSAVAEDEFDYRDAACGARLSKAEFVIHPAPRILSRVPPSVLRQGVVEAAPVIEGLREISAITDTSFEHSGEMANGVDRIQDIAVRLLTDLQAPDPEGGER